VLCLSRAPAPSLHYTLSLHDALPISPLNTALPLLPGVHGMSHFHHFRDQIGCVQQRGMRAAAGDHHVLASRTLTQRRHYVVDVRSEEHTSELQSRENLVCRLLLEKKK